MSKIARVDAFYAITKAIEKNDTKRANAMFKVVVRSIKKDKENKTFSEFIELENDKEEKLFEKRCK